MSGWLPGEALEGEWVVGGGRNERDGWRDCRARY